MMTRRRQVKRADAAKARASWARFHRTGLFPTSMIRYSRTLLRPVGGALSRIHQRWRRRRGLIPRRKPPLLLDAKRRFGE